MGPEDIAVRMGQPVLVLVLVLVLDPAGEPVEVVVVARVVPPQQVAAVAESHRVVVAEATADQVAKVPLQLMQLMTGPVRWPCGLWAGAPV